MDQICNLMIPVWLLCGERMDMVDVETSQQSTLNWSLERRSGPEVMF